MNSRISGNTKWYILIFCGLYLAVQFFFIAKAHFISDKRFGFWMFAETTFFSAELYRITTDGQKIKTKNGYWRIKEGKGHINFSWNGLVRDYRLNNLEKRKRAKGSMSRTLMFLDEALDFVADRIPNDNETKNLVLEVTYQKAGRSPTMVTLESKERQL